MDKESKGSKKGEGRASDAPVGESRCGSLRRGWLGPSGRPGCSPCAVALACQAPLPASMRRSRPVSVQESGRFRLEGPAHEMEPLAAGPDGVRVHRRVPVGPGDRRLDDVRSKRERVADGTSSRTVPRRTRARRRARPTPPRCASRDVLVSVEQNFPLVLAAMEQVEIAEGKLLAAQGGFDFVVASKGSAELQGFYENERFDVSIEQPTALWGTSLIGGYRIGRGDFRQLRRQGQDADRRGVSGGRAGPAAAGRSHRRAPARGLARAHRARAGLPGGCCRSASKRRARRRAPTGSGSPRARSWRSRAACWTWPRIARRPSGWRWPKASWARSRSLRTAAWPWNAARSCWERSGSCRRPRSDCRSTIATSSASRPCRTRAACRVSSRSRATRPASSAKETSTSRSRGVPRSSHSSSSARAREARARVRAQHAVAEARRRRAGVGGHRRSGFDSRRQGTVRVRDLPALRAARAAAQGARHDSRLGGRDRQARAQPPVRQGPCRDRSAGRRLCDAADVPASRAGRGERGARRPTGGGGATALERRAERPLAREPARAADRSGGGAR